MHRSIVRRLSTLIETIVKSPKKRVWTRANYSTSTIGCGGCCPARYALVPKRASGQPPSNFRTSNFDSAQQSPLNGIMASDHSSVVVPPKRVASDYPV